MEQGKKREKKKYVKKRKETRDLPWLAAALHFVGQLDVLTVNVELPLTLTQDAGQNGSRMDPDAHINRWTGRLTNASVNKNLLKIV